MKYLVILFISLFLSGCFVDGVIVEPINPNPYRNYPLYYRYNPYYYNLYPYHYHYYIPKHHNNSPKNNYGPRRK